MLFGRSGFMGCPVTKSLSFFYFASTLWSAIYRMKKLFHFDFIMVFRRAQYWRVLTHSLAFMSSVELILGLLLLYTFRLFERRWGSRKFASFLFVTWCLSIFGDVAALFLFSEQYSIACGPYGVLFALMVQYLRDVEPATAFSMFGLRWTEKIFPVAIALQMSLFSFPSALFAAGSGVIAGILYRHDVFHFKQFQFPRSASAVSSKLLLPILGTQPPSFRNLQNGRRPARRRNPALIQPHGIGAGEAVAAAAGRPHGDGPFVIRQEDIQRLQEMGFDEEIARNALESTRGRVEAAIEMLLGE